MPLRCLRTLDPLLDLIGELARDCGHRVCVVRHARQPAAQHAADDLARLGWPEPASCVGCVA
jgi:hypothetical protein